MLVEKISKSTEETKFLPTLTLGLNLLRERDTAISACQCVNTLIN